MLHTSWSSLRCNLLAFKQHWEFKQQRKGFSILSTQQSEQETHLDPISKITAFQISKISRQPDSLVTQDMITEHSVPTRSKSTFACWIRISNWLCSHAKTSSWTGRWAEAALQWHYHEADFHGHHGHWFITSMEIPGSENGGTVPYKAIFCGDIPLHRPYIGLIYGRYLQFRFLKWPLITVF